MSQIARTPTRTLLIVTAIVAVILGAAGGYAAGYLSHPTPTPQTRDFYLFNGSLPFNETTFGLSHDTFAPDRMIVNRGDTVNIHYVNVEDAPESHSFTMDNPYYFDYVMYHGPGLTAKNSTVTHQQNVILAQGANATITFKADQAGVFRYYCIFHQPTMTGYINVVG
jgi:plastocyanin